jgi:hypothetical protein
MDPLTLFKQYNLNGQLDKIRVDGDRVLFGNEYVFPIKGFTAFRHEKDYETVGVVLHVLQTKQLTHPEYLKSALAAGVTRLPVPKRIVGVHEASH